MSSIVTGWLELLGRSSAGTDKSLDDNRSTERPRPPDHRDALNTQQMGKKYFISTKDSMSTQTIPDRTPALNALDVWRAAHAPLYGRLHAQSPLR